MPNVLAKLRHWWTHPEKQPSWVAPFAIPCACGHMVTGQRKKQYQVVPCPACKGELFVLPLSPLPRAASPSGEFATPPPIPQKKPATWPWPLLALAVGCAFLLLLGIFWLISLFFLENPDSLDATPETERKNIQKMAQLHAQKADEYIALGHFSLALEQLNALAALQQNGGSLGVKPDQLNYQRKEIALYVDLLGNSLEELMEQAIDLPEAEWQQLFTKRYQNKAVILDMELTRFGADEIQQGYTPLVAGQRGNLILRNLGFIANLPLGKPKRVLLGARLASIHRQKAGVWIIHFYPDNLILLTNPTALAISCPALSDGETKKLLLEQQQIVAR